MSSKTFDNTKINVEFDEDYQSRININSGENISSLFAKIRRFILDLKSVAFSGSYNDLSDTPDVVTKEYVDPIKSQAVVNRTTLGMQRKNLLKNTSVTKTVNGVTFTVNDDKSITVSGKSTSSSTTFFNVCKALELTLENDKSYIMTGCPENNKSSDNKTLCYLRADSSKGVIASDTGNGVTFTTSESSSPTYAIICVSANADFTDNPVTFYPMIRYADILDDTYEPYQPSLVERCLLKDTAGEWLGVSQSSSITIDNLSSYTALWVNVAGGVSGINFTTNLIVPIAYLAKSTSNSVQLAGGIPSSAYITSEGVLAAKDMDGTITAKVNGNTLDLTIGEGTIGSVEVISLI